jgi:hypothetical protein
VNVKYGDYYDPDNELEDQCFTEYSMPGAGNTFRSMNTIPRNNKPVKLTFGDAVSEESSGCGSDNA